MSGANSHPTIYPGTVTISADEYFDLVRSQTQLETLLTLYMNDGYLPASLMRAFALERNITEETNDGDREAVLLDEAQGKLHDQ